MDFLRACNLPIRNGIVFILLLMHSMVSNAYVEERLIDSPCSRTDNQFYLGKIIAYKGLAYFCSEHPEFGKEVHVTNGAEFGTSVLIDLDPGPGSSSPFGFFVYNDLLFFIAETTQTGYALWKTDGTEQGTSMLKALPFVNTDPSNYAFEIAGETNQGIFVRVDDSLIRTDGTSSGTQVIDVPIVSVRGPIGSLNGSQPSSYKVFNSHLYVLSITTLYRVELSGSSTEIITIPGNGAFEPSIYSNFSEFNGRFLIHNYSRSAYGETWLSDGTSAGTTLLRANQERERFIPLGVVDSKIVFATHPLNDTSEKTVYATSDGTTDIAILTDYQGGFSQPGEREIIYGDKLITGSECFGYGQSILTDGTSAGSVVLPFGHVCRTDQTGFPINSLMTLNNKFVGYSRGLYSLDTLDEIWLSDGTTSGSSLLLTDERNSLDPFATTSQHLFFEKNNQLWSSDGSSTIKHLSAINLTSNTNTSQTFRHYTENDRYYLVRTSVNPSENFILHSNGTVAGTYTLKYRFENGLPEPEPVNSNWLVPILMLLEDDEVLLIEP